MRQQTTKVVTGRKLIKCQPLHLSAADLQHSLSQHNGDLTFNTIMAHLFNSLPTVFLDFFCLLLIFFQIQLFGKILSGIPLECQTVWIQSPDQAPRL